MATLTAKQERFCEEYVVDFNATQAAIRAGYAENSARQQGSRLLTKDDIAARVAHLMTKTAEQLGITAGYVLRRLRDSLEVNFPHYEIAYDERGRPVPVVLGNPTASIRAAELLGKHLALFTDRLEVTQIPDEATVRGWIEALEADIAASTS